MDAGRIRRVRTLLGMSQSQISFLFGISAATWNRYENGHSEPGDWLTGMLRIFERVAADPRIVGEISALRRDDDALETPALFWFILDKAYRTRFTP